MTDQWRSIDDGWDDGDGPREAPALRAEPTPPPDEAPAQTAPVGGVAAEPEPSAAVPAQDLAPRGRRRTRARGKSRRAATGNTPSTVNPATAGAGRSRRPRPTAASASTGSSGKRKGATTNRPWLWPLVGFVLALAVVALALVASAH
ncbi:MAG: hypothetical protein IPL40_16220 [Proteobacteria bacterium]|nr:hypothetical protein [Pseudomonadota bacterium]